MRKLLLFIFIFISFLATGQEFDEIYIRDQINLGDSGVTKIYKDTLVNPPFVRNLIATTPVIASGNDTEVQFNDNGVLGSNPSFTYDTTEHTLNIDTLKLGLGESVSWNGDEYTLNIETGLGPVLQVGQEIYILLYNNTGSTITNTMVLRPVAAADVGGVLFPTVEKAIASVFSGVEGTIMVSTMDIPDGTVGVAVRFGRARGTNTSGFSPGDALWVSAVDSGVIVNVRPEFPNYDISIGGALNSASAPDGEVFISVTRDIFNTFNNFWNGVFRETFDFIVTEAGGVITGTLTPSNGHPDMTMIFSDGFTMLDTDPGATIVLTAGTDVNPQTNYVYIPESTKVLTVSTSDWPTAEHIKVAQLFLQTAATTGTEGALRNQNWNDHLENTTTFQGHLSHITEKLRQFEAQWDNGTEGTSTIDNASTPDDVWVSTTAGEVYQLHRQSFPVFDTEIGSDIHVVNHSTTPYTNVTNLNTQLLDANGVTLNNQSFSFVLWGVANKSGDTSHIMINLPTDSYAFASPDNAVSDALNYSVYTIPKAFQGVGFLIARFTYTYKNDDWVLFDTEDLRGQVPNTSAGGGGGGGSGVSTFLGLTDTESSYTAYEFQVANVGATALESPIGLRYYVDSLVVDSSAHIGKDLIVNGNVGIGTSAPEEVLHIKGAGSQRIEIESEDANTGVLKLTNTLGSFGLFTQTDNLNFYDFIDTRTIMTMDGDGNVGINDGTPTYKLDVNGTGRFTGNLLLDSDFGFSTAGVVNIDRVLDEDDLVSDNVTALATQQSIKAYVDGAAGLLSGLTTSTNTALGVQALNALTTGFFNTVSGYQAGLSITEGFNNTIVGQAAGATLTTGQDNTFVGAFAGNGTTGDGNIFIGNTAGENETGSDNLYIDNTNTVTPLIGGDFAADQIELNGGLMHKVTTVNAATYDLLTSDYILHVTYTTTGAVTSLTLPTAQTVSGRIVIIKDGGGNASTNSITIDTEGGENIDGSATNIIVSNYGFISIYSDGSNWFTF